MTSKEFHRVVWGYYDNHQRSMPWRVPEADGSFDPYKILVSELMLQQTQVSRVIPKFNAFIERFPTIQALSTASFSDVLPLWNGLGYNRRARYLHDTAKQIVDKGALPLTAHELESLKGIGPNTAAAIIVYSYNSPEIFIETNIRTVYIHHFFTDKEGVSDEQIREKLEQTLDYTNPREFYWALMDYGTRLKQQGHGKISRSKHYKKQSTFNGSIRQLRGRILRELMNSNETTEQQLIQRLEDERTTDAITQLISEKLIAENHGKLSIAK